MNKDYEVIKKSLKRLTKKEILLMIGFKNIKEFKVAYPFIGEHINKSEAMKVLGFTKMRDMKKAYPFIGEKITKNILIKLTTRTILDMKRKNK